MSVEDIKGQAIASYIAYLKTLRFDELQKILQEIINKESESLSLEDAKLLQALMYVDKVREFIANPGSILGSELTKHGEIAEQVDVCIRNANRVLEGLNADATFENVGRTAPEDYIVSGQAVQSKFYNGMNNTLKAVLEHKDKYNYFGSDGQSYYVIPKDQYEILLKVQSGDKIIEVNGQRLSINTIEKAKELIKLIEMQTQRPFNEVAQPSVVNYNEVQIGTVDKTLDKQEDILNHKSNGNKDYIKDKTEKDKEIVHEQAQPSFAEATKVAGIAAAFGGCISFGMAIYKKKKNGKSIEQFTSEDWKDVGLDTGKGATKSGITAYSVYYLTNFLNVPAPMASSYVSATFGVISIANQFRKGEIEFDEFVELSQVVCIDSAISALGAAVGQIVIPVPVLGAVLGSIATNMVSSIVKNHLNEKENQLMKNFQIEIDKKVSILVEKYQAEYDKIMLIYKNFGELTEMAFNFEINNRLRLVASIKLAKYHGVEDINILKSKEEIDIYFKS